MYRNLHKKSSKVSVKTRSTQAPLSFKGQPTKHTTVKWSAVILTGSSCKSQVNDRLEELEGVSTFTDFVQAFSQFGSDMVDLAHLSGDRQNVSLFHFKLSFVFNCVMVGEPRNCRFFWEGYKPGMRIK